MTSFKSSGGTKRQRIKEGTYVQVNLACFKWLLLQRSENIPIQIHGKIIREKALEFAKELNLEKFQASDGWLHSWKARYNISLKEVSGESKSVTREMTAAWNETSLPTILSRYELKDIYNTDDFGLFYQGLSKKTLHLKSEKCSGGKYSKLRLTGMAIFSINMWLKSHNIEAMSDGTVPYPIQNSNHQNSITNTRNSAFFLLSFTISVNLGNFLIPVSLQLINFLILKPFSPEKRKMH